MSLNHIVSQSPILPKKDIEVKDIICEDINATSLVSPSISATNLTSTTISTTNLSTTSLSTNTVSCQDLSVSNKAQIGLGSETAPYHDLTVGNQYKGLGFSSLDSNIMYNCYISGGVLRNTATGYSTTLQVTAEGNFIIMSSPNQEGKDALSQQQTKFLTYYTGDVEVSNLGAPIPAVSTTRFFRPPLIAGVPTGVPAIQNAFAIPTCIDNLVFRQWAYNGASWQDSRPYGGIYGQANFAPAALLPNVIAVNNATQTVISTLSTSSRLKGGMTLQPTGIQVNTTGIYKINATASFDIPLLSFIQVSVGKSLIPQGANTIVACDPQAVQASITATIACVPGDIITILAILLVGASPQNLNVDSWSLQLEYLSAS